MTCPNDSDGTHFVRPSVISVDRVPYVVMACARCSYWSTNFIAIADPKRQMGVDDTKDNGRIGKHKYPAKHGSRHWR